MYIMCCDAHCILLLVYVNQVIVTGTSMEVMRQVKGKLKHRFKMMDSGACIIELIEHKRGIPLCQRRYIRDI